jgi:Uma2 family endonuclease
MVMMPVDLPEAPAPVEGAFEASVVDVALPIDDWQPVSWETFVQWAEDVTRPKRKSYYHHGRARFEGMPTGSDHSQDHIIMILAIGLYAMLKQIPINTHDACSYRKAGVSEFQPDISCYTGDRVNAIPNGTRVVDLDQYPVPNLVIEISDTTFNDDLGLKRLQYEELGIGEYWIVNVQTSEIIAFSVSEDGVSRRIHGSQVLPQLAFKLLEETLLRRRESDQSSTIAWFMTQVQTG